MKKVSLLMLSIMLVSVILAGCGDNNNSDNAAAPVTPAETTPAANTTDNAAANQEEGYADGSYYAEAEIQEDTEWQEVVAIQVEGGKIVSAKWTALNVKNGGIDKSTYSANGQYGMVAKGKAQAEWHEQAAKAEQFLIEKQDPAAITFDAEGHTDAISGVSIHVNGFVELADKALKAGPVERGPYKDGNYYAEADSFDEKSGWKETASITVMNGKIIAASWNGIHKDGGTDKITRSKSGEYGMVAKGNAQAEWHEQAYKAEQYLLEKQDPALMTYDDGGYTDAISGVSIHINGFVDLAAKALENAK